MPDPQDLQQLQLLVGQLTAAAEAAADGLKTLATDSKEHDKAITKALTTLDHIQTAVNNLTKVIHSGNGAESIISQLATAKAELGGLRHSVEGLKTKLEAVSKKLDEEIKEREDAEQKRLEDELKKADTEAADKKKESRASRTSIIAAVIAGVCALAAAIIAAMGG